MSGKQTGEEDKLLAWASSTLAKSGFEVETAYLPGDPEQQIMQAIADREIDMLLMGAYSRSSLKSLFLGSKTNDLLRLEGAYSNRASLEVSSRMEARS